MRQDAANLVIDTDAGQLQSMLQRQQTLAALARRSVSVCDVTALALDAARHVATVCQADFYALTERSPSDGMLHRRFVKSDPATEDSEETHDLSDQHNQSMSAFAIQMGQSLLVSDVAADPRFADKQLDRSRVTCGIECPFGEPRKYGSLGIYGSNGASFSARDVLFLESVGHLLAQAFARRSAEVLVEEQGKRLAAINRSNAAPMLELTAEAIVRNSNEAAEELTEFTPDELKDRSFFSAFILPEEADTVMKAIKRVQQGAPRVRFECTVLTKSGDRRSIIWTCTGLQDAPGQASSTLLVGVDVTEHQQVLEKMKRAEATAENAQRALKVMHEKVLDKQKAAQNNSEEQAERRRKDRVPFPYTQRLAPMFSGVLPALDTLYEVGCKDLSSYGFSFLAARVPDFQQLVVAFGKGNSIIYLIAEVVHVTPEEDQYLIGCRYTGRAHY